MCVTPSVNKSAYDTLYNDNNTLDWLDHYDKKMCNTKVCKKTCITPLYFFKIDLSFL